MVNFSDVQVYSGLTVAAFLYPHLVNTVLASFGEAAYENFQITLRTWYRNPVADVLIVGGISVHLAASILKKFTGGSKGKAIDAARTTATPAAAAREKLSSKVHRFSGWVMAVFIGGHVYATRFASPDLRIAWAGNVYLTQRVGALFIPYYILFGAAGAIHLLLGTHKALIRLGKNVRSKAWWPSSNRAGAIVAGGFAAAVALGVLSFAGVVPWVPTDIKAALGQDWVKFNIQKAASLGLNLPTC